MPTINRRTSKWSLNRVSFLILLSILLLCIQVQFSKSAENNGKFSSLDKDVVEQLIQQWAPLVWLAPEEKFLPLGVDEFLHHVHTVSRDGNQDPRIRMPLGDNSKKSYLVTNGEVEELLDNDNSFIYGKNPNQHPVPIYAVVKLCNVKLNSKSEDKKVEIPSSSSLSSSSTLASSSSLSSSSSSSSSSFSLSIPMSGVKAEANMYSYEPVQALPPTIQSEILPPLGRGRYIPVSIKDGENLGKPPIKRSSRVYQVFKRTKRNVSYFEHRDGSSLGFEKQQQSSSMPAAKINVPTVTGTVMKKSTNSSSIISNNKNNQKPQSNHPEVSEFIANLADNVKFTGDSGMSNNIDDTGDIGLNSKTKQQTNLPSFHVTYWMFYPYSQGKRMCTIDLGLFGSIPFPVMFGFCMGSRKDIGSHIGDWEHMSLFFDGKTEPESMYVSAHDAGAYYSYNHLTGSFEFKSQETRKGILQRPNFPKTVTTSSNHPVLFAAKGSHGLWTAPGKHRFVKVARLYDINGFGTPWHTWKSIDISYENLRSSRALTPDWLYFKGKWGNPKSKCHPLRRIGLNFCEYTDGPTGIPLKEPHFQCKAI